MTGDPKKASGDYNTNHMVAVVDGDIYDSWDSTQQLVKWVCTIHGEKQNRKQEIDSNHIYTELFNRGREIIADTIESSRFYKKTDGVEYRIQTSSVPSSVVNNQMYWYISYMIRNGEYSKKYTISYGVNPTHSAEQNLQDAYTKLQAKTKQSLYNLQQIITKLFAYEVYDDVDTHYIPGYGEKKQWNSIPRWAQKRTTSFYIGRDYDDARSMQYEMTIKALPEDPRFIENPSYYAEVYFNADSKQDLLVQLDDYKKSYLRFLYDY